MRYFNHYQQIQNEAIVNSFSSKYLIYSIETIYLSGAPYFKVLLLNRVFDGKMPKRFDFKITVNEKKIFLSSIKIAVMNDYSDNNILGCLVKLDSDLTFVKQELRLMGYVGSDGNEYRADDYQILTALPKIEDKKFRYVQSLRPDIRFYPFYAENYWICRCGCMNQGENEKCDSCQTDKSQLKLNIPEDIDSLIYDELKQHFDDDVKLCFEDRLVTHFREARMLFDVDRYLTAQETAELKERYEQKVLDIVASYKKVHEIVFDYKQSFDRNIARYVNPVPVHKDSIFSDEEWNSLQEQFEEGLNNFRRNAKRRTTRLVIACSAVMAVIVAAIITKSILTKNQIRNEIARLCSSLDVNEINLNYNLLVAKEEISCEDFGLLLFDEKSRKKFSGASDDVQAKIYFYVYKHQEIYSIPKLEKTFNMNFKETIGKNSSLRMLVSRDIQDRINVSVFKDIKKFSLALSDVSKYFDDHKNFSELVYEKLSYHNFSHLAMNSSNLAKEYYQFYRAFYIIKEPDAYMGHYYYNMMLLDYISNGRITSNNKFFSKENFYMYSIQGGEGDWQKSTFPYVNEFVVKHILSHLETETKNQLIWKAIEDVASRPGLHSGNIMITMPTLEYIKSAVGDISGILNRRNRSSYSWMDNVTILDRFLDDYFIAKESKKAVNQEVYRFLKSNGAKCYAQCGNEKFYR